MDRAVVKLNALSDADGPRAEDQHFFAFNRYDLALLVPGGVEVGGVSLKLSGTGVDHFVGGAALDGWLLARELFNDRVGKGHALGFRIELLS
ncbi:hypothetical protein SDC9_128493 [bioreactor metagenome]|uniref:Uncharacterized protein n=1 Tax=bioreactor metagenome TaxID=1076179 RepID=A0A645CWA6_9ZZZZ